jgi:drug/metabolite transporter (DMT)-like permease
LFPSKDVNAEYPCFAIIILILAAFSVGISFVIVRKVQMDYAMAPELCVFYNALVTAIVSPCVSLGFEKVGNIFEWKTLLLMASLGLWTFLGQVLMNTGFNLAPAGSAALLRNFDVVFSFLYDIVLFSEIPNQIAITGAALVATSSILLVIERRKSNAIQFKRKSSSLISEI